MTEFFAELKRRNIYRVAAAYAVVAWLLLQILNNVAPALDLPPMVFRAFLLFLALCFPLAILLAWAREVPVRDGLAKSGFGMADWVLSGALLLVVAAVSYEQIAAIPVRQQGGIELARAAATAPAGISVAVLPFANLSPDKDQEFFSDGVTEEITTALAKIPDLRVVARQSAFQYKGEKIDMREIGRALNATHLISGSVRKAGDRLRITAQLIKADDGVNIWADTYDRELNDIFAIQEGIARAIAVSFNMQLGLKPGENLVSNRKIDTESYQQYLQAKALDRTRSPAGLARAIALLEQVLARNPDYAPAWALLGRIHNNVPNYSNATNIAGRGSKTTLEQIRKIAEPSLEKAQSAAQKAIALDPDLPDGYVALAQYEQHAGNFLAAEDLIRKALSLDPNHPEALDLNGNQLAYLGFAKKGLSLIEQALAIEPLIPVWVRGRAINLWLTGENDAAIAAFRFGNFRFAAAVALASAGRFKEAAETLRAVPMPPGRPDLQDELQQAARLLDMAPADSPPKDSPPLAGLDFVYLFLGAPERVLGAYELNVAAGYRVNYVSPFLWHPAYSPARKTERFKKLVRDTGYVDYWKARGWPDFCHPIGAGDFACE